MIAQIRSGSRPAQHPALPGALLAALLCALLAPLPSPDSARATVATADGGIEFSYYGPGVGSVFLAGSFNGWNATQLRLTDDGAGNWTIVHPLGPGKHEYKFVVDGAWFADPDNANTVPDPYGGANSLVEVGGDGKILEAAAERRPISNTTLNARLYLSGRYLTRYESVKNQDGDERFRLQRPSQKVDLNFHATVSELVDSYSRIRLDNEENIIQNNISGFLDEASLTVHPEQFHLIGYWDMEIFELGDPIGLGGDVDLPGSILDDHLAAGKGTAGATIEADPLGLDFHGFFANVHDADVHNDPDLFDNTGKDLIGLRLSKRFGKFEIGVPAYLTRQLLWMDFGELVGQTETGLPSLDDYLARSGDQSTWFEFDDRFYQAGLDLTRRFLEDRAAVSLEWLYGDYQQAFVTGNDAGPNNENGVIDVPILTRAVRTWHGSFDYDFSSRSHLNLEHTITNTSGAHPSERELLIFFKPADEANKNIFFALGGSPPPIQSQYSEATLTWEGENRSHVIWLQRILNNYNLGQVGATVAFDTTITRGQSIAWILSGRTSLGAPKAKLGRWEFEHAFTWDNDDKLGDSKLFEVIVRNERKLSRNISFVADIRYAHHFLEATFTGEDTESFLEVDLDEGFWAPYAGLRYQPNAKVEVIVAYGVDPLVFSIDYNGRHIGRWQHRQLHIAENIGSAAHQAPELLLLDAERNLEEARVIGARAIFRF